MNQQLNDVICAYVSRDGELDPVECWSEEDLRKLIKAARAEIRRRAKPQGDDRASD